LVSPQLKTQKPPWKFRQGSNNSYLYHGISDNKKTVVISLLEFPATKNQPIFPPRNFRRVNLNSKKLTGISGIKKTLVAGLLEFPAKF
jgi:hypothetical protein